MMAMHWTFSLSWFHWPAFFEADAAGGSGLSSLLGFGGAVRVAAPVPPVPAESACGASDIVQGLAGFPFGTVERMQGDR
jgi:hypothetical protein